MRHATLDDWLAWQQTLHPSAIDLGLERVRTVAERLGLLQPQVPVITVAGTNGKGSCIAYLEAITRAAGYRPGAYTSPHLLRYNERIRLDGREAEDAELVEAFARIDAARGEISLTYFEFGTLAAFELFRQAELDVWLLEVGLGGRLDAVNVLDADCAIITSIDLDHTDWLGPDRDSIGAEKAGIMRAGRPAIYAEADMPASVERVARERGAQLLRLGHAYRYTRAADGSWCYTDAAGSVDALPAPRMAGAQQYDNAAAVIAGLRALAERLPVATEHLRAGLAAAEVAGRVQVLPGAVEWMLDVAHNPESVQCLARVLAERPARRTLAVFAQMQRKSLTDVLAAMSGQIEAWYLLELPDPDARPAAEVGAHLGAAGEQVAAQAPAEVLFAQVQAAARAGDRVLVFGSFRTVEEALRWRHDRGDYAD